MAQTPRGGLYKQPCKGHLEVCAIYSETTGIVQKAMCFVGEEESVDGPLRHWPWNVLLQCLKSGVFFVPDLGDQQDMA